MTGGATSTTGGQRLDDADIKQACETSIRDVWAWLGQPELPANGGNARAPWRNDSSPSLQVGGEKNIAYDHGTGESFDAIALVKKARGCTFGEAVRWIVGGRSTLHGPARAKRPKGKPEPTPILPVPADAPTPPTEHFKRGRPSRRWEYRDPQGRTLGFDARFDKPDGGKDVLPLTFCRMPDGTLAWRWKSFSDPRPLYGLDRLAERPDAPVLWVEGCKSSDAAAALFPDFVTVASPGGCNAVGKTDYRPLKGRRVWVWGDNDAPGRKAAQEVARLAHAAGAAEVHVVDVPRDFPGGWDLADTPPAGWDVATLRGLLDAAPAWTPLAAKTSADASGTASGGPHPLTDLGNAERFRDRCKSKILFDVRVGRWRVWDGKRWKLDGTGHAARLAHQTARAIYAEAQNAPTPEAARALAYWARKSESKASLSAMVDIAKTLDGMVISGDQWDADAWSLNVENGVVDLRTGTLRPHNPGDHFTKLAPVYFDPDARHAILDKVLIESMPDETTREYLMKLFGYALCGEKGEKILAFIYGPHDSMKSTLCDAFLMMLGDYSLTVEPETFGVKNTNARGAVSPEVARMACVRYILTAEISEGHRLDSGFVKRVTGGENIVARNPYALSFEFRPEFLIVLMSNHRPVVSDSDDALWERLRVVPFDQTIPLERRDPAIKRTLENDPAARAALLAWAVKGCLLWQKQGLAVPEIVQRATGQYRESMDCLSDFITDCCMLGPTLTVSAKELRAAYESWAREAGVKRTLSPNQFADRLKARGCDPGRNYQGRFWSGIGLAHDGHDGHDANSDNFFTRNTLKEKLPEVPSSPSCGVMEASKEAETDPDLLADDPLAKVVQDELPY